MIEANATAVAASRAPHEPEEPQLQPEIEAAEAKEGQSGEERRVHLGARFLNPRTIVSFLFGIAILVAVFRSIHISPSEVWAQLKTVDARLYVLAIAVYCLTFPFRGLRWQHFLRNVGCKLPLWPLAEVIFISWFVNSVLPGKVGDVYRGYLLRKEYGLSMSRTIGTVAAERVMDVLVLVFLLGTTGYLVLRGRVAPQVAQLITYGWIGFAALLVGLFVVYKGGDHIVRFLPERFRRTYEHFAHGTFSSLRNPAVAILVTSLSWSAEAGRLFFVMQALHVAVSPLVALFTVAAISLALIIPTPGGLGGVEGAFVLVLPIFGVATQTALAVALLDRLISYYGIIAAGLPVFLLTKRGREVA